MAIEQFDVNSLRRCEWDEINFQLAEVRIGVNRMLFNLHNAVQTAIQSVRERDGVAMGHQ